MIGPVSTPGDQGRPDPTRPGLRPPQHGGPSVNSPRFGDAAGTPYQTGNPPLDPTSADRDPWWHMAAPILAGLVLIGGIAFLVLRGGDSNAPATSNPTRIAEAAEPGAPLLETTVPVIPTATAPPLFNTTLPDDTEPDDTLATTPSETTDATTTVADAPNGPTEEQMATSMLRLDDLDTDGWEEVAVDLEETCDPNPLESAIQIRTDRLFQQVGLDPPVVRQIGHSSFTFADEATALAAFDADVDILRSCSGDIELDGVSYQLVVAATSLTEAQASSYSCSDQNSVFIVQLSNTDAPVPFIAQSIATFRCGRNVTAIALTSTLDLDDLTNNTDFPSAVTQANIRTSLLPGS